MKRQKIFNYIFDVIAISIIILMYSVVQKSDHDEKVKAEQNKAEIIAAAKAEFLREKRYGNLAAMQKESERMTFPLDAYHATYNRN